MLSKEELILLHHYLKEGLAKTTIATRLGISRRTVHRYVTTGKAEPQYGPRQSRVSKLDPYQKYLRGRVLAYPELSGARLLQELRFPLVQQPAYAPELNPVERLIEELRRAVEGKLYPSLEEKMAAIEAEPRKWDADVNQVRRLANWEWIKATLIQISDPNPIAA